MAEEDRMNIDEKQIVIEISSDENGNLFHNRPRLYTAYCRVEARQLYQGRDYQRALRIAENHVDDNPSHVVTVIGS